MADNRRSEGNYLDIPNVIMTGETITAGSMVQIDQSGTGIVRPCSAIGNARNFIGVLTDTITGATTGCVIATEGVYEFLTEANSTGSAVRVGQPVFPVARDTVRGFNNAATATTVTGVHPIGVCVLLPQGIDETATSVRCWVKIYPFNTLPFQLGVSGVTTV